MLDKINEINNKLKEIIEELSNEKDDLSSALEVVQQQIDSKIDEAKGYKTNVDEYKANISLLEEDIASFEKDLEDLKSNYGNKGLDAIVDVGTKEINSKIVSKQKEIAKQVEKINELTDRARTIKELLINLKKDKKDKKEKFDSVSIVLEYYSTELNKIIEYSEENPDSLVYLPIDSNYIHDEVPVIEEPLDDSPVFDEIASIDKEDNSEVVKDEPIEEHKDEVKEEVNNNIFDDLDSDIDNDTDNSGSNDSLFITEEDLNMGLADKDFNYSLEDSNNSYNIFDEDITKEEDEEDSHFDDTISSLFANQKDDNIDFKTLNDSIDKEYENIFGKSLDSKENLELDDKADNLEDHTGFTDIDLFGDNKKVNLNTDIVSNFFMTNKLDFNKFSVDNQKRIRDVFSPISFTKVLEVLRKNNIELDAIYSNPDVFQMDSNELDSIISKLLLAGQSIHNISLVLGVLPSITLIDLNDVINSYGNNIKNIDITDIIVKAKHLSDIGRGDK